MNTLDIPHLKNYNNLICYRLKLCTPQSFQVLVSDNDIVGIKLAETLISSGAKNLILYLPNKSNLLLFKSKCV